MGSRGEFWVSTTAFNAKDAIIALLSASPSFDPDAVYYGHPGTTVPDFTEWVWVGEIEWDNEEAVALGGGKRDEVYRIIVTLESHVPDDTQRDANYRVKTKMYAIEQMLAVGPGNPNPLGISSAMVDLEPQFLGEGRNAVSGRGAILVLSVRVQARK